MQSAEKQGQIVYLASSRDMTFSGDTVPMISRSYGKGEDWSSRH